MSTTWPFKDPPGAQAFVDASVLQDRQPIHFVSHDEHGGVWRFSDERASYAAMQAALPVTLSAVLELDPTLGALADLAPGWVAFRLAVGSEWVWLRPPSPYAIKWRHRLAAPEVLRLRANTGDLVFRAVNPNWWNGELVIAGQRIMLGGNGPGRILSSLKEALSSPLETKWKHAGLDVGRGFVLADPYVTAYTADSDGKRLLMFEDSRGVFFATLSLQKHECAEWLVALGKVTAGNGHSGASSEEHSQ